MPKRVNHSMLTGHIRRVLIVKIIKKEETKVSPVYKYWSYMYEKCQTECVLMKQCTCCQSHCVDHRPYVKACFRTTIQMLNIDALKRLFCN